MTWSYIALPASSASPEAIAFRYRPVLSGGMRQHRAVDEIAATVQRQFLDELAIDRRHFPVAGELDELIVELQVQQVILVAVVGLDRLLHPLDDCPQATSAAPA